MQDDFIQKAVEPREDRNKDKHEWAEFSPILPKVLKINRNEKVGSFFKKPTKLINI